MLQILGLSARAERVYRAMLAHPGHGVAALAGETSLDVTDVRAALDELGDLALLRASSTGGSALRPVSPEVGLTALLATAESEAAKTQARIEATRAEIAAIAAEHERHRGIDGALRLEGIDAVRIRLEELQRMTRSEVLSLNPGGAHRPDARAAAQPLNQQALERGVVIRAICRDSFRNDADTLAYAQWMTGLGGFMRTVPTVPLQMIVIDRKVVVLPLDPGDPRAGALEVRNASMVAVACALFEQVWSVGTPFGEAPQVDDKGCTPEEITLLRMISQGDTDEAAARKLGVSLRTVRRRMAELMDRLGASSRFQAGVNAARRGWI
ncbi:helix-turn-helix transcriptional regulator [Streptomyces chilikensis]|uniref:LuxR C-terminal-related transcriptional regulator n=1 Tax=Streptomyces chilikensis TaxID=1194079 RepID=A0ABV3EVN9_9ACTN